MNTEYLTVYKEFSNRGKDFAYKYPYGSLSLLYKNAWAATAQAGFNGLSIPRQYGGEGLNAIQAVAAVEALSYQIFDFSLLFGLWAQNFNSIISLVQSGNEQQQDFFLRAGCKGEIILANAITEPEGGSDAFSLSTVITDITVAGQKTFITNAGCATHFITYLKEPTGQISTYILPATKHIHCVEINRSGFKHCSWAGVLIDNAPVNNDYLLGNKGDGKNIFARTIQWERLALAAFHIGIAQRLIDESKIIIKNQGKGFTQNQHLYQTVSELEIKVQAARLLTIDVADGFQTDSERSKWASAAKLLSASILKKTCRQLNDMLLQNETDLAKKFYDIITDSAMAGIYSGSTEIQLSLFHLQ